MISPSDPSEPSMEEILTSIRRIISDEKKPIGQQAFVENKIRETDILELRDPLQETEDSFSNDFFQKNEERNVAATPEPLNAGVSLSSPSFSSLLSQETLNASANALNALDLLNKKDDFFSKTEPVAHPQKPMEKFLEELLTPLLKEWLEAHLPGVVRDIVTAQVQQIIRQKGI